MYLIIHCSAKLPKWFGERPGQKAGEPDSPEDEEAGVDEIAADEDEDLAAEDMEEEEEEEEAEEEEEYEEEEEEEEEE